jgi:hypothetical protein
MSGTLGDDARGHDRACRREGVFAGPNPYEVAVGQEIDHPLQRHLVHFCRLTTWASEVVNGLHCACFPVRTYYGGMGRRGPL